MNSDRKNRSNEEPLGSSRKRHKPNSGVVEEIKDDKWTLACKEVSGNEYFDYRARFQLVHLPACTTFCDHGRRNVSIDKTNLFLVS